MPLTVATLFTAAKVRRHGIVAWGERIPKQSSGPGTGVYIFALTDNSDALDAALASCPLSDAAVRELLKVRRAELKVDGRRPDAAQLAARLAGFWCPDEVVLYIGCAGPRLRTPIKVSELSDRVAEYYMTPLGANSPHAGGWPLKTLANLDELHVHYAYYAKHKSAEKRMLDHFAEQLSDSTRESLHDSSLSCPSRTSKTRASGASCPASRALAHRRRQCAPRSPRRPRRPHPSCPSLPKQATTAAPETSARRSSRAGPIRP